MKDEGSLKEDLHALRGINKALRLLVDRTGEAHKDIAAKADISPSAFSRFLSGELNPRLPVLGRLLEQGLNASLVDLAEALTEVWRREAEEAGEALEMRELLDTLRAIAMRYGTQPQAEDPTEDS